MGIENNFRTEVKLELVRLKEKEYIDVTPPEDVEFLRIWYCGYRSYDFIRKFSSARVIEIAGFNGGDLEVFSSLEHLEVLRLLHVPKLKSLCGIWDCKKLRRLSIETAPSSDGRKNKTLTTLRGVDRLTEIEIINFTGYNIEDESYDELLKCRKLHTFNFGGVKSSKLVNLLDSNIRLQYGHVMLEELK